MSTFSFSPAYAVNQNVQPRVRMTQFGDGYMQRSADGINTQIRIWNLNFKGIETEIDAVESFLSNENGLTSFDWLPPTGLAGKWICPSWDRGINDYNDHTLTTQFIEVFGE